MQSKEPSEIDPSIILLTNLDVWMLTGDVNRAGIGNQSLYNTLLGYAQHGYSVHMLTTSFALKDMTQIHPRVYIYRHQLQSYEALNRLRRMVGAIPGISANGNNCKESRITPVKSLKPQSLGMRVYARVFSWEMVQTARHLIQQKGLQPAFIYGHEIIGVHAASRLARQTGLPLITRFQGTELSQFLDRPDRVFSYTVHTGALRAPADLVIMANDGTQGDKILDLLGVEKERYRFYMNGVQRDIVYRPNVDRAKIRQALGIHDGQGFLLYTGRFFYWKRIDRHLHVLRRVRDAGIEFKAVFIGDGPERRSSQELAKSLDLNSCVLFLDPRPHTEVMDYMNACDIYISFQDLTNLGNPAIEACICGKCIVTTAVGGTTDLLSHNVNALVIEDKDDLEAIAAALEHVIRNPEERMRLAKGARERGKELKSWTERMDMEIEEVEAVLARKKASG
ncbi:MAG: glycosyltransferase family 4 protein [Deltaproteobacteria bacterium]|nr:glycosyltransferase family 4 protein [Deltaproteobacteria bacterium]